MLHTERACSLPSTHTHTHTHTHIHTHTHTQKGERERERERRRRRRRRRRKEKKREKKIKEKRETLTLLHSVTRVILLEILKRCKHNKLYRVNTVKTTQLFKKFTNTTLCT